MLHPHLQVQVMIGAAKNGGVKIPIREHRKPNVASGSRRAIADADVGWWEFKSSAENALQHLRKREMITFDFD